MVMKKEHEGPVEKWVELTSTEPILGMSPQDPKVLEEVVIGVDKVLKAGITDVMLEEEKTALMASISDVDEDEVEEEEKPRPSTVFPRDEQGNPIMWNYQVKGMFKDVCRSLRLIKNSPESKLTSYKKRIDGLIFVYPRKIPFILPEGGETSWCVRTLRVSGPKGERVTVARSQQLPAGTKIRFKIKSLDPMLMNFVDSWLDYGIDRGLGQWRNSGMGTYTWRDLLGGEEEEMEALYDKAANKFTKLWSAPCLV